MLACHIHVSLVQQFFCQSSEQLFYGQRSKFLGIKPAHFYNLHLCMILWRAFSDYSAAFQVFHVCRSTLSCTHRTEYFLFKKATFLRIASARSLPDIIKIDLFRAYSTYAQLIVSPYSFIRASFSYCLCKTKWLLHNLTCLVANKNSFTKNSCSLLSVYDILRQMLSISFSFHYSTVLQVKSPKLTFLNLSKKS